MATTRRRSPDADSWITVVPDGRGPRVTGAGEPTTTPAREAGVPGRPQLLGYRPWQWAPVAHPRDMGLVSGAASAVAVLAVVGGAALLVQPPVQAPAAAPRPAVVAAAARVDYGWPTGEEGEVVRAFVAPPEPWAAGHRGVDLALAEGAVVRAAADGVVAFAGTVAGRGVVSVDHDDGVRTTYEPVTAVVRRGESVGAGDVLGHLAGLGHCAPDVCLHWGARRGRDDYLDPLSLLERDVVIRLLPEHGRG